MNEFDFYPVSMSDASPGVVTIEGTGYEITDDENNSSGILDKFRAAAARFSNAYSELRALDVPADAPEYGEWISLQNAAANIEGILSSVASGVSDAWNWVKSSVGLSGARRGARKLSRVGVIPVLALAAAGGAIALLVAATNNMMQFIVNWRRAESGKKPVTTGDEGGAFGGLANLTKWVVIGGALYMILPQLMPELTRISRARIR